MRAGAANDRRSRWGTSLLLGALFLFCYVAAGREALHGYDAFLALRAVQDGRGEALGHVFYWPLARATWLVLQPVVGSEFAALRILSAIGVALGVVFVHRTALALAGGRARGSAGAGALAAAAAIAWGAMPAAVWFATTVEVDGLLLGASSLAWLLAVRLLRRPRARRAVPVGAATGVTACLHGGGHLLLATVLAVVVAVAAHRALRRRARRRRLPHAGPPWRTLRRGLAHAAIAAAVHIAIVAGVAFANGAGGQLVMAGNTLHLGLAAERLPRTLLHEWLLPYAPFSLPWLACFWRPALRAAGVAFGVCLCGYLLFTNVVMGHFEPMGPQLGEHGAFLVGIASPMVLLAMLALPRAVAVAAAAVAVALGLGVALGPDWRPMPDGFAAELRAVAAEEPLELWTDDFEHEAGWVRKHASELDPRQRPVSALCRRIELLEQQGPRVQAAHVQTWFDLHVAQLREAGRSLLITERCLAALRAQDDDRLRALAAHVTAHYELEPVGRGAFRALRVLPTK